jgi:lysophospholipase L1-like esterase
MSRFAREEHDPHCLTPAEADGLLAGAPWKRLAVLGDSIAAGVLEPLEGYEPKGWTDRLAEALGRQQPELAYLNLGTRGLRTRHIREAQLRPALAFAPDLAAVICGGNDLLVRHFDAARVERELDLMVAVLQGEGAEVMTSTLFDMSKALDIAPEHGAEIARRMADLFDAIRRVAYRRETLHIDFHEHPACADPGIYASDFQHANARGHAIAAAGAIERLGERLHEHEQAAA